MDTPILVQHKRLFNRRTFPNVNPMKAITDILKINKDDKEDGFKVIEDQVSSVYPTGLIRKVYREPIIYLNALCNKIPELLKSANYNAVDTYQGITLRDSIKLFVQTFDNVKRERLTSPPEEVDYYLQYLYSQIPQKALFPIANTWPPTFPKITNTIEPVVASLIKITSEVKHPNNFIRILIDRFYPKIWSKTTCAKNDYFLAISLCKYKGTPHHWAYILRETNQFLLLNKPDFGFETIACEGKVGKIQKSKDKKTVIIKGEDGQKIAEFQPYEDVADYWTKLYKTSSNGEEEEEPENEDKKELIPGDEVPFIQFYQSSWNSSYPSILYTAFYDSLKANDMCVLRAILKSDPSYEVIDNLITVFIYSCKLHMLIGTAVGMILEQENINPMQIFTESSYFRKLNSAICNRFGSYYIDKFLKKIVKMIDRPEELDERLFFSIVKYITMSSNYIPNAIRHIASVIRSYSAAKFNSRGITFILLGGFFGHDFICPVLENPARHFPNLELQHPERLPEISRLLQFVFRGARLPEEQYAEWNPRVVKHVVPIVEEFLFSLGDLSSKAELAPPTPERTTAARALHTVMTFALKHAEEMKEEYREASSSVPSYPPVVAWNTAAAIVDFFRYSFDRGAKRELKAQAKKVPQKPIGLNKLPMYGMITAKGAAESASPGHGGFGLRKSASGYGKSAGGFGMERSASGYGSDVKERGFGFGGPTLQVPKKPRDYSHNPLYKPEDDESETTFTGEMERNGLFVQGVDYRPRKQSVRSMSSPREDIAIAPSRPQRISLPDASGPTTTTDDDATNTDDSDPELMRGISQIAKQPRIDDEDIDIAERRLKKVRKTTRHVIKGGDGDTVRVREEVVEPRDGERGKRVVMRTVKKLPSTPKD